jgi:hypothetical protein
MLVDLISALLPLGRLWYGEPGAIGNAIGGLTPFFRLCLDNLGLTPSTRKKQLRM